MGNPDGGWYDDTPPRVVSSSPADGGVNVQAKKVVINFNEYIKLENAQEKVIVSPPQLEQADIKAAGKRIIVELKDTLKENTTYTIDFSDAITDNNEGNPMGHYTFSFSTSDHIDTLEVSGYVLNAEDLEPVKGMLVGLYPYDTPDSAFHSEPMMRVSRTNGSGQFTVKGVAPGKYRAFALNDADGDFIFGQKSEQIAYSRDSIVPSWKPDTRQDTIWRDSLHIANILRVPYTHFLPDNVTLRCFQEPQTDRFLLKTERLTPEKLSLYFTYGHDSLPQIKGLNFPSDSAFVVEHSLKRDTIHYWLRDTALVNQDTLMMELRFMGTDTLGQLAEQVDTITALPKISYERRQKDLQKELEKWQKEQDKKKKRNEPYDSIMPQKFMDLKITPTGSLTPLQTITFEMPMPLARCDTSMIHLYSQIDSVWYNAPHDIVQTGARTYQMNAQWQEGTEYSLEIDSAAFETIHGLVNKAVKQGLKVSTADEFSTLVVDVSGAPVSPSDSLAAIVVRLLDSSGKMIRQAKTDSKGKAQFLYVKPATYYLCAYCDMNGNGEWDTGIYDQDLQPEPVFYFNEEVECKAKWDVSRKWNLTATPLYLQKPAKITKQKPEQSKKLKNRNLDRAKQLGIEYLQDKTGMRL
ncbi:MAG: Ig-like domain-containing protein [Prevotella sp.]|nr:Ig-like domain-containing protein [Prevotella sp.]